jgi:hypothetical protein
MPRQQNYPDQNIGELSAKKTPPWAVVRPFARLGSAAWCRPIIFELSRALVISEFSSLH